MPEGPEVLRHIDWLSMKLKSPSGKWMIFHDLLFSSSKFPELEDKAINLKGSINKPIRDILCKGKYMFIQLAGGYNFHVHHRMEGRWSDEGDEKDNNGNSKFSAKLIMLCPDTDKVQEIYYYTGYGIWDIISDAEYQTMFMRIARGFIGRYTLSLEDWLNNWKKFTSTKSVRYALMDQDKVCSGIGNYLIAEIFYEAKLNPRITVGQMTNELLVALYNVCSNVVKGHYEKTRKKVIYHKKVSPIGNPIQNEMIGQRRMWWVPAEQTIGTTI